MNQLVEEFRAQTQAFCLQVREPPLDGRRVMRSLLLLVANALLLPDLEPTTADPLADPEGLDSECHEVAAAAATLGADLYWEVFDPRELSEPVAGSLSDDLADIYRDLRRGLAAAERDIAEAVWNWRFSYETHWGDHATDAIRTLQRVVNDQTEPQ